MRPMMSKEFGLVRDSPNRCKGGVIGVRQVMVDFKRTRIDERNDQSRVGDC